MNSLACRPANATVAEQIVRNHTDEVSRCMIGVIHKRIHPSKHADVIQSAWGNLMQGIKNYQPEASTLSTYVGAIAKNTALEHHRKETVASKPWQQAASFDAKMHDVPAPAEECPYDVEDVHKWIEAEKDVKMRSILTYRFIHGFTLEATGAEVGLTKERIRQKIDAWVKNKRTELDF